MEIFAIFTFIILIVTLVSIINERFIKIPGEIAILIFSVILFLILKLLDYFIDFEWFNNIILNLKEFNIESYLLDGVLCFMLFAGASKVRFKKFTKNIKSITILSFISTAISAFVYGLLFYLILLLFKINISIWICILLGCIIAPSDPIAATGILSKLGMSKNLTTVIESESLFNDGIGVVLFAFVKSIITNIGTNILVVMVQEIFGAIIVSFVVCLLLLLLMKLSHNPRNHILLSILAVAFSYFICVKFGFSGCISSVICGMIFAYYRSKNENYFKITDEKDIYETFWDIIDYYLNGILFVLIGLVVLKIEFTWILLLIGVISVICSLCARFSGVGIPLLIPKGQSIPGGYNWKEYLTLMTWGNLKGGLSLALVLSSKNILASNEYILLLAATYFTILFTVIVQGLTNKRVYLHIENIKAKRIQREGEGKCVL